MALRSSWEGFLKLSLISVPVRAYNAAVPGGGDIHFHQIHKDCGNRIKYQKVCPVHGEVSKEDIVSGYEYEKNTYVELEPGEIAQLRAENDESINIESFMPPDTIDPIYLTGRHYFLVPDGPAGQKPYQLLHKVMTEKNRHALATVIMSGHEQTVVIRPVEKLLSMSILYYDNQIKKTTAFTDEVGDSKVSAQELKLASTLVDASTTGEVHFAQFKDQYTERTREAIEAKLSGKKLKVPRHEKGPAVINLMDALKKSLKETHESKASPKRRGGTGKTPSRRKTG